MEMGIGDIIAIIAGILIPLGGGLYFIGKKVGVIDDLKLKFDELIKKFSVVESRVNDLWEDRTAPSHSPRKLNNKGESILKISGIKEIIDSKKEELKEKIKAAGHTNPYDIEQKILEVAYSIQDLYPELLDKIKEGAFKSGADIQAVLFVGGIYLRDKIFPELGLSVNDIDKNKKE